MPRFLLVLLVALPLAARAGEFAPGGDGGTLARAFALPAQLGDGPVLEEGHAETRWTLDVTSEYVAEGDCAMECILLDGETSRLRISHRRGLGGGWDFTFELPVLDRGGGFLDGWIQDWHDTFGLPDGGRELAPRDRYAYHYERQGAVLLDRTRGGDGVGDATLTLGQRLADDTALRAMAKLPTGDEDEFEGGVAGGALWLEQEFALAPRATGYFAAGVSYSGRASFLPSRQNRTLAFGGLGLMVPVTRAVRISAQLQAHGRLYDGGDVTPLRRPGVPLTLGLEFRTGPRATFEIGFQEDPSVNGSPDFAAYLSLRSWR